MAVFETIWHCPVDYQVKKKAPPDPPSHVGTEQSGSAFLASCNCNDGTICPIIWVSHVDNTRDEQDWRSPPAKAESPVLVLSSLIPNFPCQNINVLLTL